MGWRGGAHDRGSLWPRTSRTQLNEQELEQIEVSLDKNVDVPQTMDSIVSNPAYLLTLHKFVLSARRFAASLGPTIDFMQEARALLDEAEVNQVRSVVISLYEMYIASNAPHALGIISEKMRADILATIEGLKHDSSDAHKWRHVYDVPVMLAMKDVENRCLKSFLKSRHYQYVLSLKSKERVVPTSDYFRVVSVLGKGAFGQVVEVVKRDCGHAYAMKIQSKAVLSEFFGEDAWENLAMMERQLLATLHHPLLVNLAYAFQTVHELILVMDTCPNGDLSRFGRRSERNPSPTSLTAEQQRFVGLETAAVLLYLHEKRVLYRDLKLENMLLDAQGHVRLIDFGVSKQEKEGAEGPTTSTAVCGTNGYMAPEVYKVEDTRQAYSYSCDWFSYGVCLYELCEHEMPFGAEPEYESLDEYRQPTLVDESGTEVPFLYDFLAGLLDWDPASRTSGDTIKQQTYFDPADWELVGRGRMQSPMVSVLVKQDANTREQRQSRAAVADKLSSEIARSLASSQKDSELAAAADDGDLVDDTRAEELAEKANLMHVDNWEFVSEHALAREYVMSAATDLVSSL